MAEEISLTIESDEPPSETVIAAFTYPGMSGMIACNYLIEELDLEQTGYIQADGLPALAPFENGRPYHPTRLHSRSDLDVTVLTSELPVPLHATEVFGRELLTWILDREINEVAILLGVGGLRNVGSSDEIHYVASPDYTEQRLQTADFTPLAGGFFDGITASLVSRAIDTPLREYQHVQCRAKLAKMFGQVARRAHLRGRQDECANPEHRGAKADSSRSHPMSCGCQRHLPTDQIVGQQQPP